MSGGFTQKSEVHVTGVNSYSYENKNNYAGGNHNYHRVDSSVETYDYQVTFSLGVANGGGEYAENATHDYSGGHSSNDTYTKTVNNGVVTETSGHLSNDNWG